MLTEYTSAPYAHGRVETQTVFDRQSDHYLLMIVGTEEKHRRVHGCLVHIDIKDGRVLMQRDGTEHGTAPDLVRHGIMAVG